MLFKKKDKESKPKKEKKVPVMKVGTHKKTVIALWLVLIASVSLGCIRISPPLICTRYMRKKSLNSVLSIPTR